MKVPTAALTALTLVAGLAVGAPRLAQDPPPPAPEAAPAGKEVERLKAWPEVDKETVKVDVERLRVARTDEMAEQADQALRAAGPGVVPYLLPKYGREKDEAALERMVDVLNAVTDARCTRLLAESFEDKELATRVWALRRVALFPDAGVRKPAEKALASVQKRKRDQDKEEVFAAALCCASAGSFEGFQVVFERAQKDWGDEGAAIHTALTALRSKEATERVAPLLSEGSRAAKVAGLRLLAACGELETAKPLVRPFLDDNDNSLRVAAINALRGIVDGDPPLDKLSVFEAIERANKWKARL
ncbi:MAG: hypothetical protein H6828_11060 [Planctomycetes bacterium]|nr:hypothetical protein [Planctomycetota bacterium]